MDNRRADYRHAFRPHERPAIAVHVRDAACRGEIVDLSLRGMAIQLESPVPLTPHDRIHAEIEIPGDEKLSLMGEVIHRAQPSSRQFGMRFLLPADLNAAESRDRVLWRFLMQEQRRQRRERSL